MQKLDGVIADAEQWLDAQPKPEQDSATWYGFNNLRRFIASLRTDASVEGLERACHALGWHLTDQYGLYAEWAAVSVFNDRVRQIVKSMRRGEQSS